MQLAADANVLLSASLGGRAKIVLQHPGIERVFTTEVTFAEVQEYAADLAGKKRLPLDVVLMTVSSLPVQIIGRAEYKPKLGEAQRRIGRRDPDDVDLLALALHFDIPIWSNDQDFADGGVPWYTTAELLRRLLQ